MESLTVTFYQDADCVKGGDAQILQIHIDDGGAGHYFSIATERWSFDDVDELVKIVEKVKAAIEVLK